MILYLLILVIGAVTSFWGPWWVLAPICFALCWWQSKNTASAFWISAWGGITIWVVYTLHLHIEADVDLAIKVAGIFLTDKDALTYLPGVAFMSVIAAIIIGMVSGFSGLAGLKMRQYFGHYSH